ncbi:tetraspanin-9-like [Oppia nitens]|uniref:tetraspanin-9-like n=1 Tax=Oppia nitens TaxID=1686743 RepID=UPI0023DA3520|nr:tetraspanin-9-like [Oppia nitens]
MAKVTKILLFFFNFILWLIGWVLVGIGIWLIVDPKSYEPSRFIDTYNIVTAAYIMIVVGGIIMFLGLLGCAAAFTEQSFLLTIYGIVLLILFGLQVATITLGIFHGFGEQLYNFAFRELIAELQQYPYDDRARGFIDFFQVKLRCCGVVSLNDYQRYGMSIPTSCYLTGTQFLNQKGCALALREFLELRSGIIGLLCLIAALIQLTPFPYIECHTDYRGGLGISRCPTHQHLFLDERKLMDLIRRWHQSVWQTLIGHKLEY